MSENTSLRSFYKRVKSNPKADWESKKFAELYLYANATFQKYIEGAAIRIRSEYCGGMG